jgi:lipid-A-disaccharide synthase
MTKKFFIIAGEASGDLLGAKLIAEIKQQFKQKNEKVEFVGVGGEAMQKEGLQTIFPMSDLSVMGFVEVVPHIFTLLKRIKQTANQIIAQGPDFIITIDSPDFNFRVMSRLKNFRGAKKIHLIAPSVWAYRQGRARKIAKLYDLLLTILPFEPPYFTKYNLKTIFIGHPVIENVPAMEMKEEVSLRFREKYGFYHGDTLIYMTPGSRKGEVKKIFPEFIEAVNILKGRVNNLSVVIPVVEKTRHLIEQMAKDLDVKYVLITQDEKHEALFAANFSLAKSGTNTLESSLYELPMVICYKVNFITYLLAKLLLRIRFANLINLILENEVIPEMIQQNCNAKAIAARLEGIINNKKTAQLQIENSKIALKILGADGSKKPTAKAVSEILAL